MDAGNSALIGGVPTPRGSPSCNSTSARCRNIPSPTTFPTGRPSKSPTIRKQAIRIRPRDTTPGTGLGVVSAAGGSVAWIDARDYAPADTLVVDVTWSPASADVVYQ